MKQKDGTYKPECIERALVGGECRHGGRAEMDPEDVPVELVLYGRADLCAVCLTWLAHEKHGPRV